MTAQFRNWWMGRSDRERWMLGVMFALLGLLLFWLLVLRPIDNGLATARARLAAATDAFGRINLAAASLRTARSTAPQLAVTLPVALGQAAESNGFTLSRLDAQGPDRVTIAVPTARPQALFAMLGQLERQGIIVDQLTLRTNSDATLAVEGIVRTRGR